MGVEPIDRRGSMAHPLMERRAGVLCHLSSIAADSLGDRLGAANRFLDFLVQAGIGVWQTLPLNPPDGFGSPYSSSSLFAMHAGFLGSSSDDGLLEQAEQKSDGFEGFCRDHSGWLDDYASFLVARDVHGSQWSEWPEGLRQHEPSAVTDLARSHAKACRLIKAAQYLVFARWAELKSAASHRGILLLGDLPLYPSRSSADVWANQALFELDDLGRSLRVAGVPPDYFSETGQLWGNPLYRWPRHQAEGFRWWADRVAHQLKLFDVVRIDHFRGLEAYWAIPGAAKAAIEGEWVPGPGRHFLEALRRALGDLPLVAEDLGVITPDVVRLRDAFDLPGMRVLQFGFDGDPDNVHLPKNYPANTVAYTGTHDNDTTVGWYRRLDTDTRRLAHSVLGEPRDGDVPWPFIEALFESHANTAVVPLQDYLALDSDARMNTPGVAQGNWRWRVARGALTDGLSRRIRRLAESTQRA